MDVKRALYNYMWGVWPEDFLPTIDPDRFTMRVWGNRSTLLWPRYVHWRAAKEARKFAAARGFRDAKIVKSERNTLLQRYDYTVELVR